MFLMDNFLPEVFKAFWKTKNCYAEDVLKASSRHLWKTSRRRVEDQQMFTRLWWIRESYCRTINNIW